MRKFYILLLALFVGTVSIAQTTLINPATDGGFENGATIAANGWTVANASTDAWVVGAGAGVASGGNAAYVSANGGAGWTYSQFNTILHLYKNFTVPAGEGKITISFRWKVGGEGSTTSDWDNMKVFLVPTSVAAPAQGSAVASTYQISGPGAVNGMYKLSSASYNTETISAPVTPGVTYRLVFSWKSDGTDIVNPPAAIDDVSVVSSVPGTYTSVATGNWGSASTWDVNAVPTAADNVEISAGHTVTIDAVGQGATNLVINGTLNYGVTPTSFSVVGNLTVNTGGLFNVFNGTTGKTLNVSGNITNNGSIDISVGSTTGGNLTLNGSSVQTVSGSGTFGATNVIRNLTFSNSSTAIPNIVWSINNIKIAYNLNITGARIDLGSNKMTYGNNAAGNTLTAPVGSGFLPGAKFVRWWTTGQTGTAITSGTDPSNSTSRYPFINAAGQSRAMYISRSSSGTTGNTAGELAVVYTDANTTTSGLSIADGAYTVTNRYDGKWTVTAEAGYVYASGTHTVVLLAENAYAANNGNSRVITDNASVGGTHQAGTVTPGAQRTGLSTTALTTATGLHLGINAADISVTSITSGNWNNPAVWSTGAVPTCSDIITITPGTTVTVNSAANVARSVTVASGGNLVVASGDLTVGCTLNNSTLTNNGTLTVSGGTMNINGNLVHNASATFNQSGGDINVDGNANGVLASSVASGTHLVNLLSPVNWTGGTFTIVDPHAANSTTTYAFHYNTSSSSEASAAHTLRFGNGTSSEAGGNAVGFYVYNWVGTGRLNFGNVVINGPGTGTAAATSRVVTLFNYTNGIIGDLTINANGELNQNSVGLIVGGGITVNAGGILTASGTVTLAMPAGTSSTTGTSVPALSGSGTYRNNATSATANLSSLTLNNSNAAGLTLNFPLTISGALTLTQGVINTTATEILTLNSTATATATAGFVNGPVQRIFAASRNATGTYTSATLMPVGKGTTYLPIFVDPSTTSGGTVTFRAEAFTSNAGTAGAGYNNLSTNRWEAIITAGSGNFTSSHIRIADAGIASTHRILQALSAGGTYNGITPGSSYTAGPPPSLTTSGAQILAADYSGYFAYGAPACLPPTSPAVSSITTTTATANWTASSSNPSSGYEWEVRTSGVGGSGATGLTTSGSTAAGVVTANISGLTANTSYTLYVRSNCGAEFSPWTVGVSFTTACGVFSLPVNEGFNSNTIPGCWSRATVALQTGTKISFVSSGSNPTTSPYEGSHFVQYNSYSSTNGGAGSEERLQSGLISTSGVSSVDVEFYWRNENSTSYNSGAYLNEGVQLQYSTDNGVTWVDAGSLFPRFDGTLASGVAQWKKKTVTLPAGAGNQPSIMIGFKFHSEFGNNMFLDAVSVMATPNCLPPSGAQVSNVGTTTADLSWTASTSNPSNGYEWEIRTSGVGGSGSTGLAAYGTTGAGVTSASATGLTAGTIYTLFVRANCGTEFSPWAGSSTFATQPNNDEASGATTLTVGAGCTGAVYSNIGATKSTNEVYPSCSGTAQAPVWFSFVAPASGAVRISTDLGTGNTFTDSKVGVFSATDVNDYGTFNIISCDEDGGSVLGLGYMSVLYATGLTPGTTYYIAVDKYSSSTANGTFCIAVDELSTTMLATTATCSSSTQTPGSLGTVTTYTGWVPLLDANSRLIALVRNPAGGAASSYSVRQNIHTGAVRQNAGIHYLDRNYLINNSSATNVEVQFFFLETEMNALNAANGATLATVGVARQSGTTCQNNFATANGATTFLAQSSYGSVNGVNWIQVTTPSFSNFYIQASGGSVLPVNIVTFSGQRSGGQNMLKWTTSSEQNNKGFFVERSYDGNAFTSIGFVNSRAQGGNSSSPLSYTFNDQSFSGDRQYYRLRQVDLDGRSRNSNVVLIKGVRPTVFTFGGLFPNPATSKLNVLVEAPSKDDVVLQITDITGKLVKEHRAAVEAGSNTLEVDVNAMAAGTYVIKLVSRSTGEFSTGKFVKH